jgi:hypothetical protein
MSKAAKDERIITAATKKITISISVDIKKGITLPPIILMSKMMVNTLD